MKKTRYVPPIAKRADASISGIHYTYFIQGQATRLIKIGRTCGPPIYRLREMQTGSPDKLKILVSIHADVELACHRYFQDARSHGEWFLPVPELLRYIEILKEINLKKSGQKKFLTPFAK